MLHTSHIVKRNYRNITILRCSVNHSGLPVNRITLKYNHLQYFYIFGKFFAHQWHYSVIWSAFSIGGRVVAFLLAAGDKLLISY